MDASEDLVDNLVPEAFLEAYETDDVAEALRKAERAPSTTPPEERDYCPICGSTSVRRKRETVKMAHRRPQPWKCTSCGEHVDEIADHTIIPMTSDRTNEFDWIGDDDLTDPEERGADPTLNIPDERKRAELAIRLYRPWREDDDSGPAYRELAEYLGVSRWWVGSRCRAWRDGEYRDLVEDPTPTTDATGAGQVTSAATDGGRRRRRWSAYGG